MQARLVHALLLSLAAIVCASCTSIPSEPPPVDAPVYGRVSSLSEHDLKIVAQLARSRIKDLDSSLRVEKMKVFSESEVGVMFGSEGYITVERIRGRWQITSIVTPE